MNEEMRKWVWYFDSLSASDRRRIAVNAIDRLIESGEVLFRAGTKLGDAEGICWSASGEGLEVQP